jgi:hypothetical protein
MLLLAMLVLASVLVVGSPLLLLLLLLMPTLFHRRPTHNSDSRLKEEKHTVISSCRVPFASIKGLLASKKTGMRK